MRKIILFLIVIFPTALMGQIVLKSPYQTKLDSMANSYHLDLGLKPSSSGVKTLKRTNHFKLTMSNQYKFDFLSNGINSGTFSSSDLLTFANYDIRMKFYITKRIRIVSGIQMSGVQLNGYSYNTGIIIKL